LFFRVFLTRTGIRLAGKREGDTAKDLNQSRGMTAPTLKPLFRRVA
jgi:hypothetical protein